MRGSVNNNFHRLTNPAAHNKNNNADDGDHEMSSKKVPHYEHVPDWKGRSATENKQIDQNPNKRPMLPLLTKNLLPLNSSFVMNKNGGENIPPVPTNDSAALAAMLAVPPPHVNNGQGQDDSMKQVSALESGVQSGGDSKSDMAAKADAQTAWSLLHEYWTFVQENPYDFNGWIYLLSHVESMKHIEAARSAFEGFLPLYPYCFAYWKKLSDLELKYSMFPRCLGVLIYGTKSVPLCHDIWISLFNNFKNYAKQENIPIDMTRLLYKTGLEKIGLSWYSSPFWEECIKFELDEGDYLKVMTIYKWLISIPIKVYNKHWDKLVAIIRDNHPQRILSLDVFDHYYRVCCDQLKIKYVTPQQFDANKPQKLDDQIVMLIKEKILAGLIKIHEENSKQVDKRWKFEEKIKRPYFHVKPIEKKQLKAWNDYLDFEIKQGDPVRTLVLFERCLVSCAQYEEMWCRYASFLESHVQCVASGKYKDIVYRPGCFSTGDDSDLTKPGKNSDTDAVVNMQKGAWFDFYYDISHEVRIEGNAFLEQLCEGVEVGSRVLTCPSLTPNWILHQVTWEDARQVYRRASWIHCPSKPLILMQWAEFEESQGDIQTARDLLNTVLSKYPQCLKARIQLIDLERRNGMLDRVEELYGQAFTSFSKPKQKSYIAIRYARFLFKFKDDSDNALALIRKALKKDKGNIFLYNQVFNICYEKRPVDCDGVLAACMLALASKELTLQQKQQFCLQRAEFLKEHGTIAQIKDAQVEHSELEAKLDSIKEEELKIAMEKKKQEDLKQKEKERLDREQKEKEARQIEELLQSNTLELGECDAGNKYSQRVKSPAIRRFSEGGSQKMEYERRKKRHRKGSPSTRNSHDRRPHEKRRKRSFRNEEKDQNRRSRGSTDNLEQPRNHKDEFLPPPPQPEGILTTNDFTDSKVTNAGTVSITDNMNCLPPMHVLPPATRPPFMSNDSTHLMIGQANMTRMLPPQATIFSEIDIQRPKDQQANNRMGLLGEFHGNANVGNRIIPPLLSLNTNPPRVETPNVTGMRMQGPRQMNPVQNQNSVGPMNPIQNQNSLGSMNPARNQSPLISLNSIQSHGPRGLVSPLLNQGPMNPGQDQIPLRTMNPGQNPGPRTAINPGQDQGPRTAMNPGQNQGARIAMNPVQNQGPRTPMNPVQNQGPRTPMNPGQNQGPRTPMNPGQNQGPRTPMNPGQNQGPRTPMNPGQNQGPRTPMNPGQNQGPRTPMNPGQNQGPRTPMNPGQNQGPRTLMNPGQNQGPRTPMNPVQNQGPRAPMNPGQNQGPRTPMNPGQNQAPRILMNLGQNQGPRTLMNPGQNQDTRTLINPLQPSGPVRPFNPPTINRPPFQVNVPSIPRNIINSGAAVVNVPDWLVSEGGELRLSQGPKGDCILKYWPKFMNEMGHDTLLAALRKSIKWLNQKVMSGTSWVDLPMMMSWLGPCDFKKEGISLSANANWPPEIVDLLHTLSRVCEMESEFNSCLLRLFRNGYDHQSWDSEEHPAMNTNPKIAVVSVGAIRTVEMRRKQGSEYIRFPLLPGSLLFMEGATQADWIHQIKKDPKVGGERISLSFRTMLMINGLTV